MAYPKTLGKRLFVSAILIAAIYWTVCYAPLWIYAAVLMGIIAVALLEYFTACEQKGFAPNTRLGITCGVLFPLMMYYPGEILLLALAILVFAFLNFTVFTTNKNPGLVNTALTIFGLFFVAVLMSYMIKIRLLPQGALWVCYLIWVAKMGDAAAYFIGSHYGKVKLFNRISPHKSVEGALGGLACSFLVSCIFKIYIPSTPFMHFVLLGIVVGVLGQIGDLTESIVKRELNVKDSGVIPGLGGMLDIVDSLLFSTPFLYYYLTVF